MRDVEDAALYGGLTSFAGAMRTIRQSLGLADMFQYAYHKEGWFLEAVGRYCETVRDLGTNLSRAHLHSCGLRAFREYLARVRYCLLIQDYSVRVCRYEPGTDYSVEVEHTVERLKLGAVKDYRVTFPVRTDMNHVEDLCFRIFREDVETREETTPSCGTP